MDQSTRNTLRNVVTQCRKLLEESVAQVLQGQFGIYAAGKKDEVQIEPEGRMSHLSEEDRAYRQDLLDHYEHIKALGYRAKDALAQLIREVAFTHLNRFCAYRMMESRGLIRESVSKGLKSQGFLFYLADHEEDERRFNTGQQDVAYRHFLNWLGGTLSEEIGVLFAPTDPANRLYPPQRVIDQVLGLLNDPELSGIWSEDEAIGWVYQYFTPKELRDQARKESQAPRNSYELAFRNQFFTPRYVVEFLTDNTLGRIWYEMRQGDTRLKDQCHYMVRRSSEVFLKDGEAEPTDAAKATDDLSQEELLKLPVYVPFRAKKDPRELRIIDPACGSGHFLLYCFDLLLTIYEEAYGDPDLGPALKKDYPTLEDLRRDVPRLILAHNLHGIDIDPRASQIAALALWLRCQRAYQEMGVKQDRPKITRSNIVCAEPMPGEERMLKEFVGTLQPALLGQLVQHVFEKMKLAGEAGSLLQIESDLRDAIADAKRLWADGPKTVQQMMFTSTAASVATKSHYDFSGITDKDFFEQAEHLVVAALRQYAERASSGSAFHKQLFVDDAARGFSFISLCYQKFDVALMNPPFGEPTPSTNTMLSERYPETCNDLYAAFVERMECLTRNNRGAVGALTSKTFFYTKRLRDFRALLKAPRLHLAHVVDFGMGVLDAAVETSCYTLLHKPGSATQHTRFCDLTTTPPDNWAARLITACNEPDSTTCWYAYSLDKFDVFPFGAYAYWAPTQVFRLFKDALPFEPHLGDVVKGITTFDDFRFLRLWWECPTGSTRWRTVAKGGGYGLYLSDHPMVIDWLNDGLHLQEFERSKYSTNARTTQSKTFWFKAGLTCSEVSSAFTVQPWPSDRLFCGPGFLICPKQPELLPALLAFFNSNYANSMLTLISTDRHWSCLNIGRLPVPDMSQDAWEQLGAVGSNCWHSLAAFAQIDETADEFLSPCAALPFSDRISTLADAAKAEADHLSTCLTVAKRLLDEVDGIIAEATGISADRLGECVKAFDHRETLADLFNTTLDSQKTVGLEGLCRRLVSYAMGAVYGRWDLRTIGNAVSAKHRNDLFAAHSFCRHARLDDAEIPSVEYPLSLDSDGLLTDDPDHTDDVVSHVRHAWEVVASGYGEEMEREVCQTLGVKTFRDYFRKPGKGGFWDDHISRYSKSRRKAPIYWLLQSSKKNYAIWLYYHRLDKDILFKALVNYVEPKIRLETDRLESLRAQKGEGGKATKKLDKEIEKQEEFLSELRDFEEKLRRAAELHLVPDLNDGVVLNIAPLHELVPWREAEKYWEELLEGKYEWSSIGKQLREKGLVK